MTFWLAGMRMTAARLNDFTPISLGTAVTPATGFTLSSFTARNTGGTTEFSVVLVRTGATITADSAGNITDTLGCTLPSNCRPGATYQVTYEKSGIASGVVRIATDGTCTLTTLDPTATIAAGATVNFAGTFATG